MDKFDGGEESWKAWEFDFKVATRASAAEVAEAMVIAENATQMVTGAAFEADNPVKYKDMAKRGRELFEVLCMLTTGDAKAVIKEVPGGDGLAAWQLLTKSFARRTLARTLRRYKEAVNPKQVSEASEIVGALAKWENGVKELERTEDVKLPDMIKLAALTEICTDEIRDTIFQNVDSGGSYESIKEKVISWVSNRVASRSEATPMDIGAVGGQGGDHEEEYGINGMNCYRCGGEGHMSRVCPSKARGKGQAEAAKGNSDKGKGGAKGWKGGKDAGKDGGKGDKGGDKGAGKGKGYQGTCYRCGKVGHKASECYVRIQSVEEEGYGEDVGEETEVGGVWLVGNVEVKNRFDPLAEEVGDFTNVARKKWRTPCEILNVERSDGGQGCSMEFHVTEAKRMLASVSRITKAGNVVWFGEGEKESFIMNIKTGKKMYMKKERGVYVLDVMFNVGGGQRKGQIVVDSGAAECVMPRDVLKELVTKPKAEGVKFVAANGEEIGNYGRKVVDFVPFAWQAP